MTNLFSPSRLNLNLLRLPIGASDYTANGIPYSYDDLPAGQSDPQLSHFSIAHDQAYTLPALHQALALNPQLQTLATPWSAPAWMKANDSLSNLHNKGALLGKYWGTWAAYIVRFIQAYQAAGIPISALTAQNEPGTPTSYPGMDLAAWAEAKWISQNLLPALKRANLHPKLYANDLGWASARFAKALATASTSGALTGLSWHCYYGSPTVMSAIRTLKPTLQAIVSECSPGISAIPIPEVVISSLRNWASEISLWNLALEPNGGPVQRPNTGCPGCFGMVAINPTTQRVSYNLPFYDVGQASMFVQPGATRVASNTFVNYNYTRPGQNFVSAGIDDVAFENPDGSRVLLIYNNAPQPVSFAVGWHGRYFNYTLWPQAMTTFEWNRAPYAPAQAVRQRR
jgi:glucosylceramidase